MHSWDLVIVIVIWIGGSVISLYSTHAQPQNTTLSELWRTVDSTQYPTSLLYDRVVPFGTAGKYDGTAQSRVMSPTNFRQLLAELRAVSHHPSQVPTISQIQQRTVSESTDQNIYPVAILHYHYSTLKKGAFQKGQVLVKNGQLHLNSNRSSSPFKLDTLFAASPFTLSIPSGKTMFRFPRSLYLTNTNAHIRFYQVRVEGERQVDTVFPGHRWQTHFSPGSHAIHLKAIFSGRPPLTTRFRVNTQPSCNPPPPDTQFLIQSTITDFDYDTTNNVNDTLGPYGQARVSIWYAEPDDYLHHPFLVIDGFDPKPQSRHWPELYCKTDSLSTIDSLQKECYDLVVVDWVGGADWIQKNAFTLIEVLDTLNTMEVDSPGNVLFAPSMAGLISRYALSYMETHNMFHHTETYFSFDAPHQGANISLGLQHMVEFFARNGNQQSQDQLSVVNSPAAKQLLNYHYKIPIDSSPHPLRTQLVERIDNMGEYPNRPRKVAVANGSGTGEQQRNDSGQIFNPTEKILHMYKEDGGADIWADVWALPDSAPSTMIFDGEITYLGVQIDNKEVTVSGTRPYDNTPGGYSSLKALGEDPDVTLYYPYINFIPTISALDLDTPVDLTYSNPVTVQTPFDTIIYTSLPSPDAPLYPESYNEPHTYITSEKQGFLMEEAPFYPALARFTADTLQLPVGGTLSLENRSRNASSWYWEFGDGATTIKWAPSHQYDSPGQYNVTLTIWNSCDEVDTMQRTVVVGSPSVIQPVTADSVEIYPNPVEDHLKIRSDISTPLQVTLMAVTGRVVLTQSFREAMTLSVSSLSSGFYLYKISSPGGNQIKRGKLMIR